MRETDDPTGQQRKAKTLAEKKAAAIAGSIHKPLHRTLSREAHVKWVREAAARKKEMRRVDNEGKVIRVLVCGGRDYADRDRLNAELDRLHAERSFALVIAGGARGADTLAEEWAAARGVPCEVYRADWEGLGRKAGPIRNGRMLAEGKPGLVVGFPGGRGTAHMCHIAREAGIEVIEIPDSNNAGKAC